MSWVSSGGFDTDVVEPPKRGSSIWRFYMKADGKSGTKEITFVDDVRGFYVFTDESGDYLETPQFLDADAAKKLSKKHPDPSKGGPLRAPAVLMEHQLYLDGKWGNYLTCLRQMGQTCPLCESGDNPSQVAVFTIIDHSVWKDRGGNEHTDEVKLLWVKTSQAPYKLLQQQATKLGREGLRGVKYEVQRLGDKTPACGDSFDFSERVELPDDIQPVNYMKLLAPLSAEDLAAKVGTVVSQQEDKAVDY